MDIQLTLINYVNDEILDGIDSVEADDGLLTDGIVDSLGMLRLVAFIEATYNCKVAPDQLTIENFRTIEVISRFLTTHIQCRQLAGNVDLQGGANG